LHELQKRIDELETKLLKKDKIINSLKERVKKTIRTSDNSFSIFETNIMLQEEVDKKTKKLKASLKSFEYLFNNTIETIGLFQDNRCINLNGAGIKIFGFKNLKEAIGKTPFDFIAPTSIELVKYNIVNKVEEPYEAYGIKQDGTIFPVLIQSQYKEIDDKLTRITSLIDLTELKEKEKALKRAKNRAEQATKTKSEFLANMSHEIRTPINGIMGMTTLALQTNLDDKQKHYLKQIDNSSKSLLNIINDILDFSKIEAKKLTIEKVDFNMCDILSQLKSMLEISIEEKDLVFDVSCQHPEDAIFYGDSLRISQVLINLMNNAIKFTNKGFVKIYISHNKNNIITFEVSDSGIGMTKEQQSKLFQAFSQADGSTTRKYGGTGLGLSISKQLVELMGGKIYVESELNVGSKFTFEISLKKGNPNNVIVDTKVDKNALSSLQGSAILLVEDNFVNQEIVIGLLEGSGIKIDIANNGQEAVDNFNANSTKYELILMDLQMPVMGGIEATKLIREKNKNIPIIALTSNAMIEDIEEFQSYKLNEKDILFLDKIKELLNGRKYKEIVEIL